ncbi:type IV pilus biogenesis/stability protein PilW [Ramlibacter sp. USB13]|uniref:Type IV pilus biogenesis/stability protein PilW n=2 Tax=Ramlibacter cellulosilyticus TaxID=2764187 RepID=A0A923MPW6_9BURK|nr:type IV pilus biogenesis/stability protein PilW [Ramlibacter cellulosilyticus]
MAAASRFTAGGLAAVALAGVLGTVLVGCAAPNQQASADLAAPTIEESEARKRARIRLELASSYFEEGKTEIALEELKQVLAIDPNYSDAYNLRGLIFMRLGDARQAEDSFRRAIVLNPRDSETLHNFGWLQCQQGRYPEAEAQFHQALTNPLYGGRSKTFLAMGVCQARAGQFEAAERSLARSYELDAANPVTGYNLARVLYQRGEYPRAQFYIRRLNNSELANAETLWLGIKVENRMNDMAAMNQLSEQLRKRYPQSRERSSLDRKAFDE